MKLLLSSITISDSLAPVFTELVGKPAAEIKLALIENASDVRSEAEKVWMYRGREQIKSHGYQVDLVDLREYKDKQSELEELLKSKDAVWLGGGNTYYLRWLLKDTGADAIIQRLVKDGLVYGGGSAGAIVAGPALQHFQAADDPAEAPEEILDGLHLTETVAVPHADNEDYADIMKRANESLTRDGLHAVLLKDSQAVVISDETEKVIG